MAFEFAYFETADGGRGTGVIASGRLLSRNDLSLLDHFNRPGYYAARLCGPFFIYKVGRRGGPAASQVTGALSSIG